jgi:hypothetical protein
MLCDSQMSFPRIGPSACLLVLAIAGCANKGSPADDLGGGPDLAQAVDLALPDLAEPIYLASLPADLTGVDLGVPPDDAVLNWDAPTMNTDGTPLTDLAGYYVYHGLSSPITKANSTQLDVGNVTTYTFHHLPPGVHYFAVSAYTTTGDESDLTLTASKTIF